MFLSVSLNAYFAPVLCKTAVSALPSQWLAFVSWNVWIYAVFSLLYVSLVSLTVSRCIMVFKTKIWNEKSRELYDNTVSIIRDLALIAGGLMAMMLCPSLKLALVLWGLACIVDDIGWILTWFKLKDRLKEE